MSTIDEELAPVTVTVYRSQQAQVIAYAAELVAAGPDADEAPGAYDEDDAFEDDDPDSDEVYGEGDDAISIRLLNKAKQGFGPRTVKRNYLGGNSEYWAPFLDLLAAQPEHWVSWKELHEGIGLTASQCAGMLGAAERRCKGNPPYAKAWEANERWFWMPKEVADRIKELSAEV